MWILKDIFDCTSVIKTFFILFISGVDEPQQVSLYYALVSKSANASIKCLMTWKGTQETMENRKNILLIKFLTIHYTSH